MYRLVYKSEAVARMSWKSVGPILAASTRNNDRNGLTGVLLVGKKHFLQVLEGDFETVNETFQRIARDPRHRRVQLVEFGVADERLFEEWKMRGVGLFEFDPPLSEPLMRKYGSDGGEIRFPDTGWKALALVQDILQLENLPLWAGNESD